MAITSGTTPVNPCIKVQETLDRFFATNPLNSTAGKGTVEALTSDVNRAGAEPLPVSDGDRARLTSTSERKLQLRYIVQDCTLDTFTFDPCNLPTLETPSYLTADVTVTRSTQWGFQLDETAFREMCEGKTQQFNDMVKVKYESAKRNMNQQAVALVKAAMGTYPLSGVNSVTTPQTLNVINGAGGANPTAIALIETYYENMNIMNTSPIMVGAGNMSLAEKALGYSGLSSNGVDGSKTNIRNFFRDTDVNKNFGDGFDHLLTWAPGAIQFVGWNDYVGQYEVFKEEIVNGQRGYEFQKTTVLFDGILWDFVYNHSCAGIHTFMWRKYFDIVPLPANAFGACQTWNFGLHFLIDCGDMSCAQIEAATTPAASA
jgi:hypothetical protein